MKTSLPLNPTKQYDRLDQIMEEAFRQYADYFPWSPSVDIKQTEKEYVFTFELPGFDRKEIKAEIFGDVLSVWGKRALPNEEMEYGNYIRRERFYGEFKRAFKLDYPVIANSIAAEFQDGILTVVVPKLEASLPHRIELNF